MPRSSNPSEKDKSPSEENYARYVHDCQLCVYLGRVTRYDLYYCAQISTSRRGRVTKNPTLVARYGDNGPDYISGLRDTGRGTEKPILQAARDLAISKGLLDPLMWTLRR